MLQNRKYKTVVTRKYKEILKINYKIKTKTAIANIKQNILKKIQFIKETGLNLSKQIEQESKATIK